MTDIIKLNVGGVLYSVPRSTIMKYPKSMLAKMITGSWQENMLLNREEPYFVDRDGQRFQYILDGYRDNEIIVPKIVSMEALKKDVLYFSLPTTVTIKEESTKLALGDIKKLKTLVEDLKAVKK